MDKQFEIGDIIALREPNGLERESSEVEQRLFQASVEYFDALTTSERKQNELRIVLLTKEIDHPWVTGFFGQPLCRKSAPRDWSIAPQIFILKSEVPSLEEDYLLCFSQIRVDQNWIEKKIGSLSLDRFSEV